MHDIRTYRVEVLGHIDATAFNATGPLRIAVVRKDSAATLFTIRTDQSGLIGLMRHLHGQGFVLLSVHRTERAVSEEGGSSC